MLMLFTKDVVNFVGPKCIFLMWNDTSFQQSVFELGEMTRTKLGPNTYLIVTESIKCLPLNLNSDDAT